MAGHQRYRNNHLLDDPEPPALQFRQGDVLLVAIEALPEGATAERRAGRIVLAEGEATGHAHAIEERDARTFTHEGQRYLLARSPAQLIHEEHAPIAVPPGSYRILIQHEYAPVPASERRRATEPVGGPSTLTPGERWRRRMVAD